MLTLPVFLYAEVHYRIPGLFSLLDQKEPEILFDTPHRIAPGQEWPVLLLLKDAHRFPVQLDYCELILTRQNVQIHRVRIELDELVQNPWWFRTFSIPSAELPFGQYQLDALLRYKVKGVCKVCRSDNYRFSSHAPFDVLLDQTPLPAADHWYFGDLHFHSDATSDQVEFGAPLPVTKQFAQAMGLHFFAVTDHSYDLDDVHDNYLQNDPDLPKWKKLNTDVKDLNQQGGNFLVLAGEELSVGNARGENVHFLILNHSEFLQGDGDSAERWFDFRPTFGLDFVLQRLESAALAFAAHPEAIPPLLQKLLIRRGKWNDTDYDHPRLNGVQMWNGNRLQFLRSGYTKWRELLLADKRLTLVAGNDAHGNFNRYRQIGTPFLTMRETNSEVFGRARTGLLIRPSFSFDAILNALRNGRAIVTDGPFAQLCAHHSEGIAMIGDRFARNSFREMDILVCSTPTFGAIERVTLFVADIAAKLERPIDIPVAPGIMNLHSTERIRNLPNRGYFRLEVWSRKNREFYLCLTNPIYFDL